MSEENKVEVPQEFKSLVEQLDKLSALEISKFVKFLEEYWGVSAAAPALSVAAAPAAEAAAPVEEKTEFTVTLNDAGSQKVAVIKAVKELTGLALGEAKGLVDNVPSVIKDKVSKEEADKAVAALKEAGAVAEAA